jgi:dienelactone hydrolase
MATEEIRYADDDVECIGYLATPDGAGAAPAVLVLPAWDGLDAFICEKARALADLGYAGFGVDVYGGGQTGNNPEENTALMQPFMEDRGKLGRRLAAAYAAAAGHPSMDASRIAAMGYCFGGLCVLDMARAGTELRGVISNHGLFAPPDGAANAAIKARVLALHGHEDPMVPPEQVLAFEKEMTASGADWQVHVYGNTYHAFTNPEANDKDFGTVYDANADRRAWETTVNFLAECFAD